MKQSIQPLSQCQFFEKWIFNPIDRKYELLDMSLGKLLTDFRLGIKVLRADNSSTWSLLPEEFVYLVSCLNYSGEIVMGLYAQMDPQEVDKTMFYLWMRKRSRLVRPLDNQIYKIYATVQAYNADKPAYTIRVIQTQASLVQSFMNKKPNYNKVAIVRNRDISIFDVLP